jgi:hypothetical protein
VRATPDRGDDPERSFASHSAWFTQLCRKTTRPDMAARLLKAPTNANVLDCRASAGAGRTTGAEEAAIVTRLRIDGRDLYCINEYF